MAKVPIEPATAAPAVTGTEVVAVLLELPVAEPVLETTVVRLEAVVVLAAAEELAAVVPAAVVPAAVVLAAEVLAEAEAEAEEDAAAEEVEAEPLLEPAAATSAQNLEAAGRTSLVATSAPQAVRTQEVAAAVMEFWLEVVHWQV